tara:strand:+ start:525 stop:851 length:327 start_codon:yes stop_codon:yes gene_type:complete
MANGGQNGWNEYSRLVLNELESLASGIDNLRIEVQEVKQELAKMQGREDKVNELRAWKSNIDEVASATQLKEAMVDLQELKQFKTKAVTTFAVVQAIMAIALALTKFF